MVLYMVLLFNAYNTVFDSFPLHVCIGRMWTVWLRNQIYGLSHCQQFITDDITNYG